MPIHIQQLRAGKARATVACDACKHLGPEHQDSGEALAATVAVGKARKQGWSLTLRDGLLPAALVRAECPTCAALAANAPAAEAQQPSSGKRQRQGIQPLPPDTAFPRPRAPAADAQPQLTGLPAMPYRLGEVYDIPTADLHPDPAQPRKTFPIRALKELGKSMQATGQRHPITFRVHADGRLVLGDGERRWRAAQLAGIPTLRGLLEGDTSTGLAFTIRQAASNLHAALTPWDWALTFGQWRDAGYSPTQISAELTAAGFDGFSRPSVSNLLRLLDLPEWARNALRDGLLTPSHGKLLASVASQPEILETVRKQIAGMLDDAPETYGMAAERQQRALEAQGCELADTAPSASDDELDDEPGEQDPDPDPAPTRLSVAHLAHHLSNAIHRHAVDLRNGGPFDTDDGRRWLAPGRLTDSDRADCKTCPSRVRSLGLDCCARPTCLEAKIVARDAEIAATAAAPSPEELEAIAERKAERDRRDAEYQEEKARLDERKRALIAALRAIGAEQRWLVCVWIKAHTQASYSNQPTPVTGIHEMAQDPKSFEKAQSMLMNNMASDLLYGRDKARCAEVEKWLKTLSGSAA